MPRVRTRHPKTCLCTRRSFSSSVTADLDAYDKLVPAAKNAEKLPLSDLRAYCRFSLSELEPEKYKSDLVETATLLQFLVPDYFTIGQSPCRIWRRQWKRCRIVIELPHPYRPIGSVGHLATGMALVSTATTLYPRIASMRDLTDDIQVVLKSFQPRQSRMGIRNSIPLRISEAEQN